MAEQILNEDSLKQMVRSSMIHALPGKPVAVGDSWPFEMDFPLAQAGTVKMKGTYKLAGFEEVDKSRCAVLAMSGEIDADLALTEGGLGAGVAMKIESGKYSGNTYLDSSLGLARKTEMDLTIDMAMENAQLGQSIKVASKQRMVTEITKVEDL